MEYAFPGREGTPGVARYGDRLLNYREIDGFAVYGADILLDLEVDPNAPPSAGRYFASGRWEDGVIPYAISPTLPAATETNFLTAVAHWEAMTGFTFVERTTEADYVNVVSANEGCSSYVGKVGGAQSLTLSTRCTSGNAIHEIGHAIGLWHEQSRLDSPDYVVFHEENLLDPLYAYNFDTYEERGEDGTDLGEYEYGSIMHYASWAFAVDETTCSTTNVGCTLNKLDGSYITEYQRTALTTGDIWGAHRMYFDTWQVSAGGTEPWAEVALTDAALTDVQVADIDGDGFSDAARLVGGQVEIWWGDSQTTSTATAPGALAAFALADTDGDGAFEVIGKSGSWWRKWRAATSSWSQWVQRSTNVSSHAFVDINGDGVTDVLSINGSGWKVSWSGTAAPVNFLQNMPAFASARFVDLDGDGAFEVVKEAGGGWQAYTYATASWSTILASGSGLSSTFVADLDGDGDETLIYLSGTSAQTLDAGALGAVWTLDTEGGTVRVGDFDADGADDLLTDMAPRTIDPGADGVIEVPGEVSDLATAINEANDEGGLEVRVGEGTYVLPSTTWIENGTDLVGAGEGLTVIEIGQSVVVQDSGSRLADLDLVATAGGYPLSVSGTDATFERVTVAPAVSGTQALMISAGTVTLQDVTVDSFGTAIQVVAGATLVADGLDVDAGLTAVYTAGDTTVTDAHLAGTAGAYVTAGVFSCTNCLLEGSVSGITATGGTNTLRHVTTRAPKGLVASGATIFAANSALIDASGFSLYCEWSGTITTDTVYADGGTNSCGAVVGTTVTPDVDADGHLGPASDLVDIGVSGSSSTATDRDGDARPLDGDGDGVALPDVGCDERVP